MPKGARAEELPDWVFAVLRRSLAHYDGAGDISLEVDLPTSANLDVQFTDSTGKLIHTESLGLVSKDKHSLTLKTVNLPAGFYFIRLFAQGRLIGAHTIVKI